MIFLFFVVLLCYVIYKILDRLLRIPRIGNYEDRYILVTGCDTGFGNLIAKRLDHLGCHVFAGCLTEMGETELRKICSNRLHPISLDVSKQDSVRKALEYVNKNLPKGRGLWAVLNNAGLRTKVGEPDWLTTEDYKRECDINLWGLIDVTLNFLPLIKKEKGRVINTGSLFGRLAVSLVLPYSLSKLGVECFTNGLRRTLHYFGCKAILIEPGVYLNKADIMERLKFGGTKAWNDTPQEVKEEYGEEYAKYVMEKAFNLHLKLSSQRVEEVVDAYESALLCRFPRQRYLVGRDANYIFVPIQALPEYLGDWILRKLQPDHPSPAMAN